MVNQHSDARLDRRKREILDGAFEVFADKGFAAASIADIATHLRIGHGTVYRYFQNKHDVFDRVVQLVIERIAASIADELPDATDDLISYRAQVHRIAEKLLSLLDHDPRAAKVLFIEASGVSKELDAKMVELWKLLGKMTEAYLVNGKRKGFLRADLDTEITGLAINAMIFEGARQIARVGLGKQARTRWIDGITALMFDGVRAQPKSTRK